MVRLETWRLMAVTDQNKQELRGDHVTHPHSDG